MAFILLFKEKFSTNFSLLIKSSGKILSYLFDMYAPESKGIINSIGSFFVSTIKQTGDNKLSLRL